MKIALRQFKPTRAEATLLLLVSALVLVQLLWPPLVGQANNGDFERLMRWGNIQYLTQDYTEKYFAWINHEFRIARNPWLGYGFPSSAAIFIKLSAIIGGWLLPGDRFDLRILGFVHMLSFVAAFWLLLRGWQAYTQSSPFWLLPGFLLLFCDIGYTVYFHSFYAEPSSLIFLLAFVGAGLWLTAQRQKTWPGLALFCLCAGLFIAAKPQNFALIPVLLVFCARLYWLERERVWRTLLIVFAVTLVTLAPLTMHVIKPLYEDLTRYHCVFYGILKDSPTPEQDLRDLGLNERFAVLAGTTVFHPNLPIDIRSPAFRIEFYERLTRSQVLRFYLTHPQRLRQKLRLTAEQGYSLRLYLGNFEKVSGMPAHAKTERWSWWGRFKERYWPKSLWWLAAYCVLLAAWLLRGCRSASANERVAHEFGLALWLMLLISFVTPILGDGESDLPKHLFLFNAFFDLSLLFCTAFLALKLRSVFNRRESLVAHKSNAAGWTSIIHRRDAEVAEEAQRA